MNSQGLIVNFLNQILKYIQNKTTNLNKSFILKNIDNIILFSMLLLFFLSLFCSSEILGFAAIIIFALTLIKLFTTQNEKLEMNGFEKCLLIYLLVVIISLAGSTLFHLSLKGFNKTLTYMLFYFSAVHYFRKNTSKIPYILGFIALCVSYESIIGFIQNFAQVSEISTWQDTSRINPEEVMTRVYGTLKPLNPNLYGGYLVATISTLFGGVLYSFLKKKYYLSIAFLIFAGLSSLALILSGCRGAYIALFVILILFALFIAKYIWDNNLEQLKKIYTIAIGTVTTAGAIAALTITPIRTRIFSIFVMRNDSSTSFRFNVYQSAIQMIKDNWLLGIGVGNKNFREIYGLYMRTGFDALSTYSVYLEIFVESGIFALTAFLAFLVLLIKNSLSYIFKVNDYSKCTIMAIAIISIIAVMIHGFVDTIFFRPQVQFIFWTMTAIISSLLTEYKKECK